ncbi:hypothetical protein C0993_008328 [Termitomyces sp. T159_Od127]|nr:hypothetical protein C0993_008328 [Termitomyces sp. T159_Od127]
MPASDTTASAEDVNMLRESQSQLASRMDVLLSRFQSITTLLPNPLPLAATSASPAQQAAAFVLPIPGIGVNGASTLTSPLSLRSHFPDVNAAVIVAIITHDFKAADLHKLDPANCNREVAYTFNCSMNQFKVSPCTVHDYKNPFTVLVLLTTYFKILAFHVNDSTAMDAFWDYTAHLLKLMAEYEWSAVYVYHLVFFNRRRAEMASSNYSRWRDCENRLLTEHIYSHRKASPAKQSKGGVANCSNPTEACRKFNDGKCLVMPCPWDRLHTCSSCGKPNHSKLQHKD